MDEAWLREVVGELAPHTVLLSNLFRDQLDRYGELEVLADDWSELVAAREGDTAFVLNADDPLVADLGRDADGRHAAGASPTSGSRTARTRWSASSTRRTRSTAAAAAPPTATRPRTSATSATTAARTAATRARSRRSSGREVELLGMSGSRFTLASPRGEMRVALRLPGLYNVYNARRRRRPAAWSSG